FCSQAQGLVLVDKDGKAVRNAFSYMDPRAKEEIREGAAYGLQIAGCNIAKVIPALLITGAAPVSVKDPVWKYNWTKKHEPDNFKKVYKWLDVKESLIARMTGEFVMTYDSAFGTMLYDYKHKCFSPKVCKMFGVDINHMPRLIASTDCAGEITEAAAKELGLVKGIKVYGGGMDANLIGVGAGSVGMGDTHIYSGTSGWIGTITDKSVVDVTTMIAAVVAAQPGKFNYFAEMETSGKCFEWVKDHIALDEVGIYFEKHHVAEEDYEQRYINLFNYMASVVEKIPAGSGGVIFTPWLHGNRCPFEDPLAKGMFFNISLETGKTELIRAVLEGICYHKRWMLEASARKVKPSDVIRFVGGGALDDFTCQLLADITGHVIETVASPQNIGAVGAAACCGVGMGAIPSFDKIKEFIPAKKTFKPNLQLKAEVYDKQFEVFKNLYKSNKENFKMLNK
ncbi:MAG: FGGY-family carbohydrate kinase, partial [Clostridia bacterium]|nr:FGGY-family carbohydrate kinase [Clostridia bacterium]